MKSIFENVALLGRSHEKSVKDSRLNFLPGIYYSTVSTMMLFDGDGIHMRIYTG